jgi:hypothetical protein
MEEIAPTFERQNIILFTLYNEIYMPFSNRWQHDGSFHKFASRIARDLIWLHGMKSHLEAEKFNKLHEDMKDEFKDVIKDMTVSSKESQFAHLRRILKQEGVPSELIFQTPKHLYDQNRLVRQNNLICRRDTLKQVNARLLIEKMVSGLRAGVERSQCPLISFCLSYLIGLRANDLNANKPRRNGYKPCLETYEFIEDTEIDGERVIGSIINKCPSKQHPKKETSPSYCTIMLCPHEQELVKKAISLILDFPADAGESNAGFVQNYHLNRPCAPIHLQEWSAVWQYVRSDLNLQTCCLNFDASQLTAANGRAFVNCCIKRGLFNLEQGLNESVASELVLGHEKLSSSQLHYQVFDVGNIESIPDLTLRKCENINNCKYGAILTLRNSGRMSQSIYKTEKINT